MAYTMEQANALFQGRSAVPNSDDIDPDFAQ
jgi:hypothetical protein